MREITQDNVIEYIKQKGRRGKITTDYLLDNADLIKAMHNPLGREILTYLSNEYEALFLKIIKCEQSQDDVARFKVIRDIILRLSQKVADYERRLDEISAAAQKKGE